MINNRNIRDEKESNKSKLKKLVSTSQFLLHKIKKIQIKSLKKNELQQSSENGNNNNNNVNHDESIETIEQSNVSYLDSYQIKESVITIEDKLGEGSFAIVYKGTWNNKQVVIKQSKSLANLPEFKNEKEMMQALSECHVPNVVQLFGFIDGPNYSIVMEHMANGSLSDYISFNKPFDWSIRYKILHDITYALTFLHKMKIVHRDVKSDNVLLDENLHAKLGDFGYAKVRDKKIEAVGSPLWAPPEIILKTHPHTNKSDIYSLAMTWWEIAAWAEPFKSIETSYEVKSMVSKGVREVIPIDCPLDIAKMITWGWNQKPKKRPDADTLLAGLESIQHSLTQ